jgi:hypothetical protein
MTETEFQDSISLDSSRLALDPAGDQRQSGPNRREARCSHTLTSFCSVGSVHPDDSKASTTNLVQRLVAVLVSGCISARAALYPAILLSMVSA